MQGRRLKIAVAGGTGRVGHHIVEVLVVEVLEGVSDPADPAMALYESGALLPGPNARLAGPTFDEWLQATIPAKRQSQTA